MENQESYNDFKKRIYNYLSKDKDIKYGDVIFEPIKEIITEIQHSKFAFKPHRMAEANHIASSQTACLNLFIPILNSTSVNSILKASGVAPSDFDKIDRTSLLNGYRIEFWDSTDITKKGLLGDHSKTAGTDSDIAIAYRDLNDELCLWLIEHKLTEKEFTPCGGYRSKNLNNTTERKKGCETSSIEDICHNPNICHYACYCHYEYWNIMNTMGGKEFFLGNYDKSKGCPFRNGMNQLWRNQLLALALEKQGTYKKVYFSVVLHPENTFLNDTMQHYEELTNHSSKFSYFTSDKLVEAATIDHTLKDWVNWYKEMYYGLKKEKAVDR